MDEIAQVNPNVFLILTGGEPLLRRDIWDLAAYAGAKRFTTVLGTNGVLLREREAERMRAHGVLGALISLDSTDRVKHDAFARVRGAWDGAVRATRVLRDAGLDFSLHMSVTGWNVGEVPAMIDLAKELGATVLNFFFLVRPSPRPDQEEEVQDRRSELLGEVDHRGNLADVPARHRHVQGEVEALIAQHPRGAHGAVPGTRQAAEGVVLDAVGGVQADRCAEDAVRAHALGLALAQQHAVGAEDRREALRPGVGGEVPDVPAQEGLAARENQEHVRVDLGDLVHHAVARSEEHTSELQSQSNLVCRLLLEKKKQYRANSPASS